MPDSQQASAHWRENALKWLKLAAACASTLYAFAWPTLPQRKTCQRYLIHDLLSSRNDLEGMTRTGHDLSLNRVRLQLREIRLREIENSAQGTHTAQKRSAPEGEPTLSALLNFSAAPIVLPSSGCAQEIIMTAP